MHVCVRIVLGSIHYMGGSRGQPREAWLAWNFQRELWFISFFLRETWSVIYIQRDPWLRHLFPRENDTNRPKIRVFKRYIINARYITSLPWRRSLPLFIGGLPELSLMIYMRRVPWQRVTTVKRGGGGPILWIINGTIYFLIKNNLSLLFLRKINWR